MTYLKFSVLSSGSKANCTYVSDGQTHILIDCGLSMRETENRLKMIGVDASEISAIFLTHEHRDHVQGVLAFAKKYGTTVFGTEGTILSAKKVWATKDMYKKAMRNPEQYFVGIDQEIDFFKMFNCNISYFISDDEIIFGGLLIEPFSVSHDATDPVGFRISSGDVHLAIATDLGKINRQAKKFLSGNDILILETNHDTELLYSSPYPWALKERIKSDIGHLSNQEAATLVSELSKQPDCRIKVLIGAHISENSNVPELALNTLIDAWSGSIHNMPEICISTIQSPTRLFIVSSESAEYEQVACNI